jgi:hypothetical protein
MAAAEVFANRSAETLALAKENKYREALDAFANGTTSETSLLRKVGQEDRSRMKAAVQVVKSLTVIGRTTQEDRIRPQTVSEVMALIQKIKSNSLLTLLPVDSVESLYRAVHECIAPAGSNSVEAARYYYELLEMYCQLTELKRRRVE